jgi:hypothetical protein
MQDSFRQVLTRLEELSLQIRGEHTHYIADEEGQLSRPVILLPAVATSFAIEAQRRYSDLNGMPLQKALDSVVYFMDRAVDWMDRTSKTEFRQNQTATRFRHLSMLNIMKSLWLLQIAKDCQEYRESCSYNSNDETERQMMKWGMTVGNIVDKLGVVWKI